MADTRTAVQRRRIMQSVGTKNTGPELAVRKALTELGYRYRLHRKDLPGSPDIAFIGRRKAIFVHGCFWHGHECQKGKAPKSRLDYWGPKLAANVERDKRKAQELCDLGWSVLTVWQCELSDFAGVRERLINFLGKPPRECKTSRA
ncbi:very short patch repair endonuclease [Novosphingobium sp. PP1Y]|uniref:very short patch repair endonuclease n=1 Tax=Novosphingobium sp. PP1Y TaxID=702113 RepID=UPI00020EE7E2|nr:very short patch repair endonuclease [Novosphingobium sp. PP1Y]CCA91332.1 DNA mismatch endonuclease, patch repair protein [Novosphingobium sp. PP1Y]